MSKQLRSIYVTALQNTHALELQALQIMGRQVERLERYPEMSAALQEHIEETHGQRDRLEAAMKAVSASPSALKEGFLGFIGNMAALAHVPAPDEILKNSFANQAFENFEIAAYTALIAIAERSGHNAVIASLQQSLQEEVRMAARIAKLIRPTTLQYLDRVSAGEKADR